MSELKPYQTVKGKSIIAFVGVVVITALYYFAQIMGWIGSSDAKDAKVKEEVKQIETAVQSYK